MYEHVYVRVHMYAPQAYIELYLSDTLSVFVFVLVWREISSIENRQKLSKLPS